MLNAVVMFFIGVTIIRLQFNVTKLSIERILFILRAIIFYILVARTDSKVLRHVDDEDYGLDGHQK